MTIIERTSKEVDQEAVELYEACKPLLDKGMTLYQAVRIVKRIRGSSNFGSNAWYKRFRDYAISQGYERKR